jgi:hypothetical protein
MLQTIEDRRRQCNGFNPASDSGFSDEFKASLTDATRRLRPLFLHVMRDHFLHSHEHPKHAGTRFNSDHDVLLRALTGIRSFHPDLKNDQIESVEGTERNHIDVWAWEALADCAESDHWYTFEKDWGE